MMEKICIALLHNYSFGLAIMLVFLSVVCQKPELRPKKLEYWYNLVKNIGT